MLGFSATRPRQLLALSAVIALAATMLVGLAPSADAATFTVTRGDDPVPGACAAGDCSLREAVRAANAAAGADTIILPAGTFRLTIHGEDAGTATDDDQGDLDIMGDLTVTGAGAGATIIEASDPSYEFFYEQDRIFHVHGGNRRLVLEGLTLSGGQGDDDHSAPDDSGDGGAVLLQNSGQSLTATDVVFSHNDSEGTGGAISVNGASSTVTLNQGELHRNRTFDGGTDGGAIALVGDGATLIVNGTRARGNVANDSGGVLAVLGQDATVRIDSAFWGSDATAFSTFDESIPPFALEKTYFSHFEQIDLERRRNETINGPWFYDADDDEPIHEIPNIPHPDANRADDTSDGGGGAIFIHEDATGTTLTFTEGRLDGNRTDGGGGALKVGNNPLNGDFASDVDVTISSSTLWGNKNDYEGGAISIWSETGASAVTLLLDDVWAAQNNADRTGGALFNSGGTVTIQDSTFRNNKADYSSTIDLGPDGARGAGGAILNAYGTLEVTGTRFEANKADRVGGGAIYDFRGDVTIDGSVFEWNKADGDGSANSSNDGDHGELGGGAILSGAGDVVITNTTFAHNKTDTGGGAVLLATQDDGDLDRDGAAGPATSDVGTLSITNSTISGNWAGENQNFPGDGAGSAVYNDSGTADLEHVTISTNSAIDDDECRTNGDPCDYFESLYNGDDVGAATTTFDASALQHRMGVLCRNATTGSFATSGNNVADDATCFADAGTDDVVADVLLSPLADNGGPNGWTHEPRADSPVVDHVASAACPAPATDQRGVDRPRGASCDAGAVEFVAGTDMNIVKVDSPDPQTVGFDVTYTITATNEGPNLGESVIVTDWLPGTAAFVSASASAGTCDHEDGIVTCEVGDVAVGASVTVTVVVTATETGVLVNTASVNAQFQADPDSSDDTAVETTTIEAGADPGVEGVTRLSGETRIQTANAISQASFGEGAAGVVVLARSDNFADGLAGTPLAISLNGPVLLSPTESLHEDTEAEIIRVLQPGKKVYILGGTAALSNTVRDRLIALGYSVERLAGLTRIDTAIEIANEMGDPGTVMVVTGFNFPDALGAGPAAAQEGASILLTDGSTKSPATESYINSLPSPTVYAIGGPAVNPYAVSGADEAIFGDDRFETAIAVAERFFTAPSVMGLARSDDFADALSGGAHIGRLGGPMVLARTTLLEGATSDYLCDNASTLVRGYVYGGPVAIDATVLQAARARIQGIGC